MELVDSFRIFLGVSRPFGLAPYKVHKFRNKTVLVVSPRDIIYSKILFVFLTTLAGLTFCHLLFGERNNFIEIRVKFRVLFFTTFTASTLAVQEVVLTKTQVICTGINFFNKDFPGRDVRKMTIFNRRLVFMQLCIHCIAIVLSFFIKVVVLVVHREYLLLLEWLYLITASLMQDLFICQVLSLTRVACLKFKRINDALVEERRTVLNLRSLSQTIRKQMTEDAFAKDYVELINDIFKITLLCYTLRIFTSLVSLSVQIMLDRHVNIANLPAFLTYTLCRLLPVLGVFECTRNEAEKTAHYVHELFLDNDDPEIREEIEIFSLQLQHRKVEFNACGFFKLDFTLLYSMIGAVTTYIITLIQFEKKEPSSAEWWPKKLDNCSQLLNHFPADDLYRCLNITSWPA